MFSYLSKALFSGFLQFKGNFVNGRNNAKYCDAAPLTTFASILFTVRMLGSDVPADWGQNGGVCVVCSKFQRKKIFPGSFELSSSFPDHGESVLELRAGEHNNRTFS